MPVQGDAPAGRLGDAAQNLEQRAFASAIASDDADDFTPFDLEGDIAQRPTLFLGRLLFGISTRPGAERAFRASFVRRPAPPLERAGEEILQAVAQAIAASNAFSIAGGGDTLAAIEKYGVEKNISYISTGGGAFLEFLEGKELPAIAALEARFG